MMRNDKINIIPAEEKQNSQDTELHPFYILCTVEAIVAHIDSARDLATFAKLCRSTNGLQIVQQRLATFKVAHELGITLFEKSKLDIMKYKDTKPYTSTDIQKFEMHLKVIAKLTDSQGSNPTFLLSILNEITSDNKLRNLPPSEKLESLKVQAEGLKAELTRQVQALHNDNNNNNNRSDRSRCIII